jgi:hypothetical protein
MQPPESPDIEYVFEKDGEEVRSKEFLKEADGYKYKTSSVLNPDKILPKITDYAVMNTDGDDITQSTFEGIRLFFIIYDVNKASTKNLEEIRELIKSLDGRIEMMALTASPAESFEAFRHDHQLAIPYSFADATVLKTIVRSNPGITLWVNGTVKGMWHHNDTPSGDEVVELSK